MTFRKRDLLKIQYGDVYVQVPVDDPKAIKDVLDWLRFLVKEVEKFKEREEKVKGTP